MKRADALVSIRVAGYHNDRATFTRIYVENRIGLLSANAEYRRGQNMKTAGVPCACPTCKEGAK